MSNGEAGGDRLIDAFLSGIDVSKRLSARDNRFPRRVEVLFDMVESAMSNPTPYQIIAHPRNYQARTWIGSVEAFEDHADIYYDRDRNQCWRRFILTKELCHLLFVGHGDDHLASTPEQIEQLVTQVLAGLQNVNYDVDRRAATESCTPLMAIEILLPNSERQSIEQKMAEGVTELEIATTYMIPVQMLRAYLSPLYAGVMQRAYDLYDVRSSSDVQPAG